MSNVFIYGLNDPVTGRCRYVGKAADPYRRYEQHAEIAERGKHRAHVYFWWRKLMTAGQAPILEVLDEVPETEWQFWEQEYIRLFRLIFPGLTNHAHGGQGGHGKHSPETIQKIAAANRGQKRSPELRKKISDLQRGKKQSPEAVVKRTAGLRAHYAALRAAGLPLISEEHKNALLRGSHSRRGKPASPAQKAHLQALADKRVGKPLSPEICAKISATKKGIPPSAATRAAVSLALKGKHLTPEQRAKISAGNKGKGRYNKRREAASALC